MVGLGAQPIQPVLGTSMVNVSVSGDIFGFSNVSSFQIATTSKVGTVAASI